MSDERPKVSVIIPVYNGSTCIREAVDSALAQDFKNFEVVVADDGSTDDTASLLLSYGDKIRVLKFEHRGISATRNAAIAVSLGEYIALLDSDDLWEPEKLGLQVAYLNEHDDCGLVYSYSSNFTNKDEGAVSVIMKTDFEGLCFKDMFLKGGLVNSTIMYRRGVFDSVGGYDESIAAMEDYELNLRIAREHKIGRVPQRLTRRRIHPDSFYSSGYDNQYIFQYPVYTKFLDDPSVEKELGTSKSGFMRSFILKFIYKNIYDRRPEFIARKLDDLRKYSMRDYWMARVLSNLRIVNRAVWNPLIPHFDIWRADVERKAKLYKARREANFNAGAGRLG